MSLMRAVVAPLNGDLMQKYGENTVDFLKRRGQVFVHGFFLELKRIENFPTWTVASFGRGFGETKRRIFVSFFLKKFAIFR